MTEVAGSQETRHRLSITALTVLACMVSSSVFAANAVVCDKTARDVNTLNVTLDELSLNAVDHVPADSAKTTTDALNTAAIDTSAISPLLTLSPRVATILDQVFAIDTDKDVSSDDESTSVPSSESFSGHPGISAPRQTSPVAEKRADDQLDLPALRERMFRKDI